MRDQGSDAEAKQDIKHDEEKCSGQSETKAARKDVKDAKGSIRASEGWGAETVAQENVELQSDKKRGRRARTDSVSSTTLSTSKNRHFDDATNSTEVFDIPDLEEDEREVDITTQVAEAPKNVTRSVQSLKELDRDVRFTMPTTMNLGLDLHVLTNFLHSEKMVEEPDEPWTSETLLQQISMQLQHDLEDE